MKKSFIFTGFVFLFSIASLASDEVTIKSLSGDKFNASSTELANALSRLRSGSITIERVAGGNSDRSINLIGVKAEYRGKLFEVAGTDSSADEVCRQKGFINGAATFEESNGWGCSSVVSYDSKGDIGYDGHYCRATIDSIACRNNLNH